MNCLYKIGLALLASSQVGCAPLLVGAGAAGAATAYEAKHKRELDRLEDDYHAGRISEHEYRQQRDQIEDTSVIY